MSRSIGILLVCLATSGAEPDAPPADDHPLSAERRAALTEKWSAQEVGDTAALERNSADIGRYSSRGDARFYLGRFDLAVADYARMIEIDPELEVGHWRLGIARYYAGDFDGAARQFERYHTFDQVDRENGIWRFLSQDRSAGKDAARRGLLKYQKDDREPFPAVYRLLSGDLQPADVLAQIHDAELPVEAREQRLFYAHLYIGLLLAVEDQPGPARDHLRTAVANRWAPTAGYGPHFMWQVARLQYEQLATAKVPGPGTP